MNESDDDDDDAPTTTTTTTTTTTNQVMGQCHVTIYPACQFFPSGNNTVRNMSMFADSLTGQIQFQFSLETSNRETQFHYNNN